jgi:hypothetical protein
MHTKSNNQSYNVIIVPEGTDEVVRIKDIEIPPGYYQTRVKKYKIDKVVDYYREYGTLDKPISIATEIAHNNTLRGCKANKLHLIDEYSRYIAAKYYLRLKVVPVKYIDLDTFEFDNGKYE